MKILKKIIEIGSRYISKPENSIDFIFPYSLDKIEKRKEIWANLQKGILLEDKGVFIPWETPFNQMDRYSEQRRDSGDRNEWYLGKRKILDGYEGHLELMKWDWLPWTNPMSQISENIGFDYPGNKNFLALKERLTDLLGKPSYIDLKKFGDNDLGSIEWTEGKVVISLIGIEHFNCRYSFNIGLIENKNEEY